MRSIGTGIALCAGAIVLTLSAAALAQPQPDPGPTPPPEPTPATTQPASTPAATVTFGSGGVSTTTGDPTQDEGPKAEEAKKSKKPEKLPWRGTVLIWDNSATTQTLGMGNDYISDNPVYESFWSFRPRYYLVDSDPHTLNVNMRFDVVAEYTNSDTTTKKHEAQFGNIWLNLSYGFTAYKNEDTGWMTKISGGPRVIFPTDKYTYNGGTRLLVGGIVGVSQSVPFAGPNATVFPGASFDASTAYQYNIARTTIGENPDFKRERRDVSGQTIISNQISPSAKVEHQLTTTVGTTVDVTEKLHLNASYIWIQQWTFDFGETPPVATDTGMAQPDSIDDPVHYRVLPYVLAGVDFDVLPELTIGGGYYNVTNQIGENGERRNPLWSPDARVYFDVTANLDEIYNTLSGRRAEAEKSAAARARRDARLNVVQNGL